MPTSRGFGGSIKLIDNIPQIAAALHKATGDAARATAQDIADTYAGRAPRDTGFMASSSYVVTRDSSTYGQGLAGGGSGGPQAQALLPEVPHPGNDQTAIAAVGAEYAAYVELGTARASAQPAFYPAADKASSTFARLLGELENVLRAFSVDKEG